MRSDPGGSKNKSRKAVQLVCALLLLSLLIVGGMFYVNVVTGSDPDTSRSYFEKVQTVEEIEKGNPTQFLKATGTYNSNFWGNKLRIHGQVINTATVANYKDVVIKVHFYSKTQTEIKSEDFVLYDHFPAHSTKAFDLKVDKPKSCETAGWEVVSASTY